MKPGTDAGPEAARLECSLLGQWPRADLAPSREHGMLPHSLLIRGFSPETQKKVQGRHEPPKPTPSGFSQD